MGKYPGPDSTGLVSKLNRDYPRDDILANTHCDICKRKKKNLQWFSASTVVCDSEECNEKMNKQWQDFCQRQEEEEEDRRRFESGEW